MGDPDNAQHDQPTKIDRGSGDKVDQEIDRVVKESGPTMPGQDQQTKIDRGSGDEVDREIDRVVKESGPENREHWDRGPNQTG